MQSYKSVYFADHPADTPKRRVLTLAFGPNDQDILAVASNLSSEEIRTAIGTHRFADLKTAAESEGLSLNAFCLSRLRDTLAPENVDQLPLPALTTTDDIGVEPIHATFRGGREDPLHNWYPYLEGYSPDFVQSVLDAFAPDARRVLDPFAGTGTTPLTVARRGGVGLYCELNPLLQYLIAAKASVLALPPGDRKSLARELERLASTLPTELRTHARDLRLDEAYRRTFGSSEFFPSETHDLILRLRSWLDALDCVEQYAAALAAVASVSSLIPVSNLIRRGDLRFRKSTSEKQARSRDLIAEVAERLRRMSADLRDLDGRAKGTLLIAGDAKRLDRCSPLELDAVVTSPPYLNGTNYYRNTKVELWFMRALLTNEDLATFRRRTVTAGINDVTVRNGAAAPTRSVQTVVDTLEEDAYDRRIPQMVRNYFSDMAQVFEGLALHVRPGAPMLVDIGDSAYANVHVDTPSLLSELLEDRGWKLRSEVVLRQRMSRGGLKLRQVLIAADAPSRSRHRCSQPRWKGRWERFKADLPHQSDPYRKRNWGHPLHSLCSYQGKMKPSLAHHLVSTFVSEGNRMLDPFGGVGTIPFEAAAVGAEAWSFDVSPAVVPITAAKLQPSTRDECAAVVEHLECFIRENEVTAEERHDAAEVRFNGPLPDYFHRRTFQEILLARRYFQEHPVSDPAAALVFSSLLHVLHGNRPYALSRRSHPITPFAPSGEKTYKSLTEKVNEKLERSFATERSPSFKPGHSLFQDATTAWPPEVAELDAVITSPPFFDSTRFYLANWMRLWFAGWSAADFKTRPLAFVDERQKHSFRVYEPVLRQARERLKSGGVCVFHLGKSKKCDMAEEIARVARTWFSRVDVFGESVAHCESHGIRDKGTVVEHSYVVLY